MIPANLIDPNAVLFMKTGAIPASNTTAANGAPQYVASSRQPTYVREDVVRIDHDITDRLHLMGHWIHDAMSQTYYPDMWSNDTYPTTGDVFGNPSWGTVIKLTQTISPSFIERDVDQRERQHHFHYAGGNLRAAVGMDTDGLFPGG